MGIDESPPRGMRWRDGTPWDGSNDKVLIDDLSRRIKAARRFPDNTDPCVRHVQIMGETLAAGRAYPMLDEERVYCAISLLNVVAALYEARNAGVQTAEAPSNGDIEAEMTRRGIGLTRQVGNQFSQVCDLVRHFARTPGVHGTPPNPCKLTECRGKPRCEKCVKTGLNAPDGPDGTLRVQSFPLTDQQREMLSCPNVIHIPGVKPSSTIEAAYKELSDAWLAHDGSPGAAKRVNLALGMLGVVIGTHAAKGDAS